MLYSKFSKLLMTFATTIVGISIMFTAPNVSAKSTAISKFDTYKGHQVYKYSIKNKHGMYISVLSQGPTVKGFYVPTRNGHHKNILLSFKHTSQYYTKAASPFYVGQLIGPVGNRIGKGQFTLRGKKYQLPTNENGNTLHSGNHGFNSVNWRGKIEHFKGNLSIVFTHKFSAIYTGFPANYTARVRYVLKKNNKVQVLISARSNKETIFDPTVHAYFNPSNSKTVNDLHLTINSINRLALNSEKIPTGKFLSNKNTPYDFLNSHNVGVHLGQLMDTKEQGYDTMFHVKQNKNGAIAKLSDLASKRSVTFYSDRNALVMYSANAFTNKMKFETGNAVQHMGLALEPQTLPDAINHKGWGNIILKPNKTVTKSITYAIKY